MAAATGRSLSAVPGSDQDPRVITSVSMPRSELEQLDALAAEHGVSRNRLVRAALRMAAHGQDWRLRAHLASLPAQPGREGARPGRPDRGGAG